MVTILRHSRLPIPLTRLWRVLVAGHSQIITQPPGYNPAGWAFSSSAALKVGWQTSRKRVKAAAEWGRGSGKQKPDRRDSKSVRREGRGDTKTWRTRFSDQPRRSGGASESTEQQPQFRSNRPARTGDRPSWEQLYRESGPEGNGDSNGAAASPSGSGSPNRFNGASRLRQAAYQQQPVYRQQQGIYQQGPVYGQQPPMYPQREGDPRLRQLRDEWEGDAVYGISPVLAALSAGRRQAHALYIQEGVGHRKAASEVQVIIDKAKQAEVPFEYLTKHDLNVLTDNSVHQGLLLSCSPLDFVPLDDLGPASEQATDRGTPPVWLALDEVTDPQNLGAALRSAFFLGAAGVLTCARNSAPLSPAVSKASAGALEHLQVHSCHAMQKTLENAAHNGWTVLGASAEPLAEPCSRMRLEKPTVLVLGSEGKGLRTTVKRACTGLIRVDSTAPAAASAGVDSLNVSVAAGILLHQLLFGGF